VGLRGNPDIWLIKNGASKCVRDHVRCRKQSGTEIAYWPPSEELRDECTKVNTPVSELGREPNE
jgi:hypothetical protein